MPAADILSARTRETDRNDNELEYTEGKCLSNEPATEQMKKMKSRSLTSGIDLKSRLNPATLAKRLLSERAPDAGGTTYADKKTNKSVDNFRFCPVYTGANK